MKVNDLRIGNWIKYEDKLVQVVQLSSLMILCQRDENQFLVNCSPKVFKPIELTEEVLLKIGFEKDGNEWWIGGTDEDETTISYSLENSVLFMRHAFDEEWKNFGGIKLYDIKYIHELQNAYYCLTGQELNIEL